MLMGGGDQAPLGLFTAELVGHWVRIGTGELSWEMGFSESKTPCPIERGILGPPAGQGATFSWLLACPPSPAADVPAPALGQLPGQREGGTGSARLRELQYCCLQAAVREGGCGAELPVPHGAHAR